MMEDIKIEEFLDKDGCFGYDQTFNSDKMSNLDRKGSYRYDTVGVLMACRLL